MIPALAHRLFVYGTLLPGEPRHDLLAGARALGAARTAPLYELVDLGEFPALVEGGRTSVTGEVYLVGDLLLAALDLYEGAPDFYRRCEIALPDGEAPAQAYVLVDRDAAARGELIVCGDWRAHRQARGSPAED